MTEGEEIVALIKSYTDQGLVPQDDPQLASKIAAISAKYAPTNDQTTSSVEEEVKQDTDKEVYLTSNQGNLIPGVQRQSSFVYMVDENTGKSYVYDDNEGKSGDTGFLSAPPANAKLKITGINSKKDEDFVFQDLSDQNLIFGGVTDPETLKQYQEQAAKEEKGYEKRAAQEKQDAIVAYQLGLTDSIGGQPTGAFGGGSGAKVQLSSTGGNVNNIMDPLANIMETFTTNPFTDSKSDEYYLDQVITYYNTTGGQQAQDRFNYLKQSGLIDDMSKLDSVGVQLGLNTYTGSANDGTYTFNPDADVFVPQPVVTPTVTTTPATEDLPLGPEDFAPYPTFIPTGGPGTFTPGALPGTTVIPSGVSGDDPYDEVGVGYGDEFSIPTGGVIDFPTPDFSPITMQTIGTQDPDTVYEKNLMGTFDTIPIGPESFAEVPPDSQLLQQVPPGLESGEARTPGFIRDSLFGKGIQDFITNVLGAGAGVSNFAQQAANVPYMSGLGMPTVRFTPEADKDPSIQGPGAEFLQDLSDQSAEFAQQKYKSLSPETKEIYERPVLPIDYTEDPLAFRDAMAAGLDPEGPPGFSIPDFLPFGGRRIDPKALSYKIAGSGPSYAIPLATTVFNPPAGIALGGLGAGGDAARDVKNTLNEAFADGELQKTDQYKKTLQIINELPGSAGFSEEEKSAKALQALKNDVDVTTTGPVGAIGAFSTYIPFMKVPGITKIASLFPKNPFAKGVAGGVKAGGGESFTEGTELYAKDVLGVKGTGGLGDEYTTPQQQYEDEMLAAAGIGLLTGPFFSGGSPSSANVGAVGGTPETTTEESTIYDPLKSPTAGATATTPAGIRAAQDQVPEFDVQPTSLDFFAAKQIIENEVSETGSLSNDTLIKLTQATGIPMQNLANIAEGGMGLELSQATGTGGTTGTGETPIKDAKGILSLDMRGMFTPDAKAKAEESLQQEVEADQVFETKPEEVVTPVEEVVTPVEETTTKQTKGVNQQAADLLNKLESKKVNLGSISTTMTNNLKKILTDNGIEVTSDMSPQDGINALREKAETSETVIQTEDAQTKTVPFKDIIAYESVQGTSEGLQVFSEGGSLGKSGSASGRGFATELRQIFVNNPNVEIISGETITNAYGKPDFKFGEIVVGVNKNQKLGSIAEGGVKGNNKNYDVFFQATGAREGGGNRDGFYGASVALESGTYSEAEKQLALKRVSELFDSQFNNRVQGTGVESQLIETGFNNEIKLASTSNVKSNVLNKDATKTTKGIKEETKTTYIATDSSVEEDVVVEEETPVKKEEDVVVEEETPVKKAEEETDLDVIVEEEKKTTPPKSKTITRKTTKKKKSDVIINKDPKKQTQKDSSSDTKVPVTIDTPEVDEEEDLEVEIKEEEEEEAKEGVKTTADEEFEVQVVEPSDTDDDDEDEETEVIVDDEDDDKEDKYKYAYVGRPTIAISPYLSRKGFAGKNPNRRTIKKVKIL